MWAPTIYSLSLFLIIILLILFGLFLFIIIQKFIYKRKRQQIDGYKEIAKIPLLHYLNENHFSRHLTPSNNIKFVALEELLSEFQDVLKGEKIEQRIKIYAETHFIEKYRETLKKGRWSKRMNVLYHIEDFRIHSLVDELIELYEMRKFSKQETMVFYRILAQFQHTNLFSYLKENHYTFNDYVYRVIFHRLEHHLLNKFITNFEEIPNRLQLNLIDVLGVKKQIGYLPFLEGQIFNLNKEIRIRALKAISEIGAINQPEQLLGLIHSEQWEERMMLAKILGKVHETIYLPLFSLLLEDASFSVRSQAAQSLSKWKEGKIFLSEIAVSSNDSYARDVAQEWLEKGIR